MALFRRLILSKKRIIFCANALSRACDEKPGTDAYATWEAARIAQTAHVSDYRLPANDQSAKLSGKSRTFSDNGMVGCCWPWVIWGTRRAV